MIFPPAPLSPIDEAAADWFLALHGDGLSEAKALAFRGWLEASDDHRLAYDRVERLWVALEEQTEAPAFQPRRVAGRRAAARRRRAPVWVAAGTALVAGLAAILILPQTAGRHWQDYRTAKGERREIKLDDGSVLTLNSASEAQVSLGRRAREVRLLGGEALFEVAHDTSRPFQVAAGDEQIRDVGTSFNVLRTDGEVTVTVLHGLVDVSPRGGGIAHLAAGDALSHHIGSPDMVRLKVDARDAASWRLGRLVYRNQSLAQVVSDLNRYVAKPITVDAAAAGLTFTGVLQLDREDVMVSRLTQLMPIQAATTATGVELTRHN